MDSEARNFSSAYPLAGERIGPAWREIWKALPADQWVYGPTFSKILAERTGIAQKTVQNLLRQAVKVGQVEQGARVINNSAHAIYRGIT